MKIQTLILGILLTAWMTASAQADTVILKSGQEIKGLVVEQHLDRIILSTVDGEMPILQKDIKRVDFDEQAYSLLSLGREMERLHRYAVALSYYEKAYQINPDLAEAGRAAVALRGRYYSDIAVGPIDEIIRQQDFQDAYRSNIGVDEQTELRQQDRKDLVWQRLGIRIAQEGDWTKVTKVRFGSPAFKKGLRAGDVLVEIDGTSLRYMYPLTLMRILLEPRYSTLMANIRRTIIFSELPSRGRLKGLGFKIKLEYDGLKLSRVGAESLAKSKGLRTGDVLIEVNGQKTRYLSTRKVSQIVEDKENTELTMTVHRIFTLARK